jgi:hypothetical protein
MMRPITPRRRDRLAESSLFAGRALASRRLTSLRHETADRLVAVLEAALGARRDDGRRVITLHRRTPR